MLFVSLSLWKLTTFDIHCSPVAGLSGWMYILFGISGSAFPATIQRELWNLYLQSSAATISIKRMYLAFLSRPVHLTLNGGNIRLWRGATDQDQQSTQEKNETSFKRSPKWEFKSLLNPHTNDITYPCRRRAVKKRDFVIWISKNFTKEVFRWGFQFKCFERRTHRQSSHLCIVWCHWDEDKYF